MSTVESFLAAIVGCLSSSLAVAAHGSMTSEPGTSEPGVVETAHYRVHSVDGVVDPAECAVILEQAWPVFQSLLHAEPDGKSKLRLRFELFRNRDAWLAGPYAGGTAPPAGLESTWFDRESRVAYVCRSTSDYETRKRIVYVAFQQFHACAKPKNLDLDAWYVHGLAESLATHAWTGTKLTLGVSPRICVFDLPARAKEALGGSKIGLDAFDEKRLSDPAVRWAAVRFAMEGAGGKYRARFDKFALGYRGSKLSGEDFLRGLGRAESISQEFVAWLDAVQMPFEVLAGEWEDLLDGGIVVRASNDRLSIACARGSVKTLQFNVARSDLEPTNANGARVRGPSFGIVLDAASGREFRMLRLRPPHAMLESYVDGEPTPTNDLLHFEGFDSDLIAVEAAYADDQVTVTIDGRAFGPYPVTKPRLGVAVRDGIVTLRRLEAH